MFKFLYKINRVRLNGNSHVLENLRSAWRESLYALS